MRPPCPPWSAMARGLLIAALAFGALLPGPPAAGEPATDRHAVLDLTFPVPGPVSFEDDYDEPRGDHGERVHQAVDVYAPKLARVHAVAAGTVCVLTDGAVGGKQVSVCDAAGRRMAYTHLNDDRPSFADGARQPTFSPAGSGAGGPAFAYAPGIAVGAEVRRGQLLGWVGDSGNAAVDPDGPQLHLSIFDPQLRDPQLGSGASRQGYRNPHPSLLAAVDRGDVPVDARPLGTTRLAGPERISTAVAVSRATFEAAETVVLVPADRPAPALVAAPLAAALDGPVLLSRPTGLPDVVAEELRRLGARHVVAVGMPATAPTEAALAPVGVSRVERIAAGDDPALSALVAARLPGRPTRVLLARSGDADDPRSWPDALTAAALGARRGSPVLLTPPDRLAAPVAGALAGMEPELVEVVGGAAAVSAAVLHDAGAAAGAPAGRLAGADRYGTAVAVARAAAADPGPTARQLWLATGAAWPDALAAGAAAAAAGAQLVLVDGADPAGSPAVASWLLERAAAGEGAGSLRVLGGRAAVSDASAAHAALVAAR